MLEEVKLQKEHDEEAKTFQQPLEAEEAREGPVAAEDSILKYFTKEEEPSVDHKNVEGPDGV